MKKTVNKFGQHRGYSGKKGPPGAGFVLNSEGNFDIQNKTLSNVKAPVHINDATTKVWVLQNFPHYESERKSLSINARLSDVHNPEFPSDGVSLSYLRYKAICLNSVRDVWDVRKKRLIALSDPVEDLDAVNLKFVQDELQKLKDIVLCLNDADVWDVKRKRLIGLSEPVQEDEVVSVAYLMKESEKLKQKVISMNEGGSFDCRGCVIQNVGEGSKDDDAVSLRVLMYMLKLQAFFMMRELTDAVIHLRKEIYNINPVKHKSKDVKEHLNTLENSFKRTWRTAAQSTGQSDTLSLLSEVEKSQLKTLLKDLKDEHLNIYLKG